MELRTRLRPFLCIAGLIPAIGLFSCIHSMARKKGNKSSLILFAVVLLIAAGLIDVI